MMQNRFTQKAQNALNAALRSAAELGHTYIGSEHLLLGLLSEPDAISARLMEARGVDRSRVRAAIVELSGEGARSHPSPADMTPRTQKIIQDSAYESLKGGQSYIGTEHLLLSLLRESDCVAVRILSNQRISVDDLKNDIVGVIRSSPGRSNDTPSEENTLSEKDVDGSPAAESSRSGRGRPDKSLGRTPTLAQYGRDLTEAAQNGKLDPIVGRDNETERVIQILSRRSKNNPCLIGEPGVGKTAVIEGLAQRMADGGVPDTIRGKRIVTLDLAGMIAGAKYRGEFEERFKNVMAEVRKHSDIILFIDEIHTIIGAGAAEGAVDAANIIKPALARGELQLIGATTLSEYRRHIERDAALERRFQAVTVGEPSAEESVRILQGLRSKYEAHHKLKIPDAAIEAAVQLSVRYIPDRFLPDKAIDLIDEAASRLRISAHASPPDLTDMESRLESLAGEKEEAIRSQNFERAARLRDDEMALQDEYNTARSEWFCEKDNRAAVLSPVHVADIVTQWTGIPVNRLLEEENHKLLHLEEALEKRVVGQSDAVRAVAHAIQRGRTGLKDPRRPIGSFIFLGPSGVGKTELSRALSEAMFGDDSALIRFDMSEYMEKHSVSKLIGSPPGYVGFEEGGQLTERIRRRPYAVLLLDEIEKAHPDVLNVLLQVLDDGVLTDSQGRKVDFRNTVIILTSNLGASSKKSLTTLGFSESSQSTADAEKKRSVEALKDAFPTEFINRIDEVIVFNRLTEKDVHTIAAAFLDEVVRRASALGVSVEFDPSVLSLIAKEGFDPLYGARPLRRAVIRLVEDSLSTYLLEHPLPEGSRLQATVQDGRVAYVQPPK